MPRPGDRATNAGRRDPATVSPASAGRTDTASLMGVVGGVLLIVGTFQPIWTSYSVDLTMLRTAGLYGLIVMAVSLTAVTAAFMKAHLFQWGTGGLAALMTILTALKEPKAMVTVTAGGTAGAGEPWSPAWGWIVLVAGCLLLLAAAWSGRGAGSTATR